MKKPSKTQIASAIRNAGATSIAATPWPPGQRGARVGAWTPVTGCPILDGYEVRVTEVQSAFAPHANRQYDMRIVGGKLSWASVPAVYIDRLCREMAEKATPPAPLS